MKDKKLLITSTIIISLFTYGLVSDNSDLVIVIFSLPAILMFFYRDIAAKWFWISFLTTGVLLGLNIENVFIQTSVVSINFPALIFAIRRTFFVRGKNIKTVKQEPEHELGTFTNNPATIKNKQLFKGLINRLTRRSILISIIVTFLLLTLGGGMLYVNHIQDKTDVSIKNLELREKELELAKEKLEYEKKKDAEAKQEEQAETLQDNWNSSETTPQVNSDLILLNLKTDINFNQGAMNSLLNIVYNDPNGACSSIIKQGSTQNHIYYMMLSFYNSKVAEYGQYRQSIPGVDNTLNAFHNTLQIVRDQCTASGYNIE